MLYVAEERTAGGRLFHALGPATANARSPIVDRRVAGIVACDCYISLEITQNITDMWRVCGDFWYVDQH